MVSEATVRLSQGNRAYLEAARKVVGGLRTANVSVVLLGEEGGAVRP